VVPAILKYLDAGNQTIFFDLETDDEEADQTSHDER